MSKEIALVTGAAGFIGGTLVKSLCRAGIQVRAGIHKNNIQLINNADDVLQVELDILDPDSLSSAMEGVDTLYHFAALVSSDAAWEDLYRINVKGTENVWNCAATKGVKRALYCSSTAVYGLLAKSGKPVSENCLPKAVEPYGRSKLMGEDVALNIADNLGIPTIIIRPVAVFGPEENTPFGRQIRSAAFNRIFLAGEFRTKQFSYVHVEDVVAAAIYLMSSSKYHGQIFNIAIDEPIAFEEAFNAYINALRRSPKAFLWVRFLAFISILLQKLPTKLLWILSNGVDRFVFNLWRPGFDITYSSGKISETSFRFKWTNFEDVLLSCINETHVIDVNE